VPVISIFSFVCFFFSFATFLRQKISASFPLINSQFRYITSKIPRSKGRIQKRKKNLDVSFVGTENVGKEVMGAEVVDTDVVGAEVVGADVVGEEDVGTEVDGAEVVGAEIVGAEVIDAEVVGATVKGAEVLDTEVVGAEVVRVQLVGAEVGRRVFAKEGDVVVGRTKSVGHILPGEFLNIRSVLFPSVSHMRQRLKDTAPQNILSIDDAVFTSHPDRSPLKEEV